VNAELDSIKAKIDYLRTRDDIRFAANVLRRWEDPAALRDALDDTPPESQSRLLAALADQQLGQLWFYPAPNPQIWRMDESETEWQGEHDWIVVGESALATTTAILVNAHTGETVLYDSDAWDWNLMDNFIFVKDSLASFVDEVALGPEYERLYYQNLVELAVILKMDADEFPGIEADPWHHLLREMQADLCNGPAVDREQHRELNRRIEAYFADDEDD
jgi:hypothetical protein